MNVVWYSPFPDGSFKNDVQEFLTNVRTHITPKQPKHYCFRDYQPTQKDQLAKVPRGTRLYIIGHCDRSAGYLSGDKAAPGPAPGFSHVNGRLALTPEQLADVLTFKEDIGTSISQIKVWACIGARGTGSFVEQFASIALDRWPWIEVFGYMDYMVLSRTGKKRGAIEQDADSRPASKSKVNLTKKLRAKNNAPDLGELDEDFDPFGDGQVFHATGFA